MVVLSKEETTTIQNRIINASNFYGGRIPPLVGTYKVVDASSGATVAFNPKQTITWADLWCFQHTQYFTPDSGQDVALDASRDMRRLMQHADVSEAQKMFKYFDVRKDSAFYAE